MPWACTMNGWGFGVGGMMGPIGFLASAVLWGLLIWGAIALWRVFGGGRHSAEGVLARRFAAGEISQEEFSAHRQTLRAARSQPGE